MHGLSVEYNGVRYGFSVQRYTPLSVYHFVEIWDQTNQQWLPLDEIEREFARRQCAAPRPIHSKRAARRRTRQYLRIWTDLQHAVAG
jgi:hypothetical protein